MIGWLKRLVGKKPEAPFGRQATMTWVDEASPSQGAAPPSVPDLLGTAGTLTVITGTTDTSWLDGAFTERRRKALSAAEADAVLKANGV